MKALIFVLLLISILFSCSKDKDITSENPNFSVSGQVKNQFAENAISLTVRITDSNDNIHFSLTNTDGIFDFESIPPGLIHVELYSYTKIVSDKNRYLDNDTLINLSEDTVLLLNVREFFTVFHDPGTNSTDWYFYGGASNDGTKYIFENQFLWDDYILMKYQYAIPSNAMQIRILLHGQSVPSYSSNIKTYLLIDGNYSSSSWTTSFTTTSTYKTLSLDGISGLNDNTISLDLTFIEVNSSIIYIDDIWIYCY